MLDFEICIPLYKKSAAQVDRLLNSIPENVFVRIDLDGWMPEYKLDELTGVQKHQGHIVINSHGFNKGLGAIRNLQIRECTKKYIQMIDADDWIKGDVIEKFKFDKDVIITPHVITDGGNEFYEPRNAEVARGNGQTYFGIPTIVFRTDYLKSHPTLVFDESKRRFEDVIFSIELTRLDPSVQIVDTPYYYGDDVPQGGGVTLSHPENESLMIEDTLWVMHQVIDYAKAHWLGNQLSCYARLVEESLRVLRSQSATKAQIDEAINMLKPYKYFKLGNQPV